ncbi:hypothetical protein E2N91_12965 [Pseudomonas syringae pv. tomato]|uniref:hypothetical protein n=2 Tax=Pseudomonas TaxID=286 RepID=UPI0010674EBC|nr:hypothetical protein [Pseudomonas syringae group genomosp. 3]TES58561.1 hypothetical protein E2N91_12965 [Pseudomonas syringae pv. tomato]
MALTRIHCLISGVRFHGLAQSSDQQPAEAVKIMKPTNQVTLGQLLTLLWQMLQNRETTFGQVLDMASACGIDGRRVLADHFSKGYEA